LCLTCQIVPKSVLERLAKDRSLSAKQRKNFEYTIKLDAEFRQLRKQTCKLTRIARLIAAPKAAAVVPTKPVITVFDSNHGQTLPGVQIPNPANSSDETARRVFAETTSLTEFYLKVFGDILSMVRG